MPKFCKRPVTIEAVRIREQVAISTLEGTLVGNAGDWLITGVKGEKYQCEDTIFRKTYEPVDEEAQAELNRYDVGSCEDAVVYPTMEE